MTDQLSNDRRKAHKVGVLRGTLIALSLLNTILLPCSLSKLKFGLIPTDISVIVNGLILLCPQTLGRPAFMLFSDSIFTLGFCTWFIFANIILHDEGYGSPSRVVTGTWSSVVTLVMLMISAILVIKTAKQIAKKRNQAKVQCKHCPHCRANEPSLTPSDHTSPSSSQQGARFTVSGLRQMIVGHAPVATDEQSTPYRDEEEQQDGKIALSDEAVPSRDDEQGF